MRPSFPDFVNEVTARTVAAGVLLIALAGIVLQQRWLALVLAAGFLARVLYGPRFSPLAVVATRVIVPRLPWPPRMVPGPPKRFAQLMGLIFSVSSAVLLYTLPSHIAGCIVLGVLVLAAMLESVFGFCVGCRVFGLLMRAGVIPAEVCERCADIQAQR